MVGFSRHCALGRNGGPGDMVVLMSRHYERKGLAYCETHYHQLFGNLCQVCNQVSKLRQLS
jgi:hypothetical protein